MDMFLINIILNNVILFDPAGLPHMNQPDGSFTLELPLVLFISLWIQTSLKVFPLLPLPGGVWGFEAWDPSSRGGHSVP